MATMAEYVRGKALPHLRAWRMHKSMGQAELARSCGLSKGTLARAERGDEIVSFTNIRKLAEGLGISVDELLYQTPEEGGE